MEQRDPQLSTGRRRQNARLTSTSSTSISDTIARVPIRSKRRTVCSAKSLELLFEDSAWTWFFHENNGIREFKRLRRSALVRHGLGRCLIKNDMTSLRARAGAGTSHEVGGSNEDFVPEAVFGLEFKHKLNQRQKVSASSGVLARRDGLSRLPP